ncbi:Panacea domain-containing protein [Amniculibacterium sp. G2-70]|uniref:Panacea domain-containing protein n=1 Tax=Amniculibacterium sp. G2-70 TaxID=2767188 RepID=UPI001654620A|nr:Panacea domain-containing protein [Amniculibacterium sp. G2-70]
MNNLEKLTRYILQKYPDVSELSKPRLVKLIYLIDWRYTIENGHQYTNIKWVYNHYGPYVNDVINLMKSKHEVFNVRSFQNSLGGISDKFELINRDEIILENNIKRIADQFIDYTFKLNWSDFINLVYSSFPIKSNIKYNYLDLVELAKEFNNKNFR